MIVQSLPPTFPLETDSLVSKGFFPDSLYCFLIPFSSSTHLVSGGVSPKCPTTLNPRYGFQNRKRHRRTEEGKEKIKKEKKIDHHHPPTHPQPPPTRYINLKGDQHQHHYLFSTGFLLSSGFNWHSPLNCKI